MKKVLTILAIIIGTAIATFFATKLYYKCKHPGTLFWHDTEVLYDTVTYVDTVKYYEPQIKQQKPNGYTQIGVSAAYLRGLLDGLPHIRADTTEQMLCQSDTYSDTIPVEVPLTQTIYSDSTYTAWVTGVNTRLDSIFVYPKREVITIKHPPKRWHIGITGGYGATKNGLSPYIGVGITYSIFSF